ncbi:hypothetical protein LTR56_021738 [Elasticomyces elasticus]|nr:hypothetical protein LTR56_021738 [Elasticomyces elasticus]KAK3630703.1 hypothetical protein LTR22_021398 [Elasticomyces elasticus]KAK4909124.1 hypothetical protein LTR49_022095 [Elasticomyces elasticus]KAK5749262.1 hypothetical protein LTS12_020704 [Elasticomyces elasticus]
MEYHTSSDPLDSWEITNDFDWLEAAFGRDLHNSAAALPYEVEQLSGPERNSSDPIKDGSLDRSSANGDTALSEGLATTIDGHRGHATPSAFVGLGNEIILTTALEEGYGSEGYSGADLDVSSINKFNWPAGNDVHDGRVWSAVDFRGGSTGHGPTTAPIFDTSRPTASPITVCFRPSDAPSGKRRESLQCGICMSNKLFDRKHELDRHMSIHFPGQYPCTQPGCTFTGPRAFKRSDKLVIHKREAHGVRG